MKTAMQELIEYLENIYYVKEILDWEDIKKNIIEKEKEQIMKANMDGYKEGCTFHSFGHRPLTTEQYYNQTYNQNK
jgi:hypothetical protein